MANGFGSSEGAPVGLERELQARTAEIEELRASLARHPPEIPSKYLYDDVGSALFDAITRLPEYFPTRTESELLQTHGGEILSAAGKRVDQLIELGSGAARKTIPLLHGVLGAGRAPHYLAVDISSAALARTRSILAQEPGIDIDILRADYMRALHLPRRRGPGSRLVVFLGGTLGNEDDAGVAQLFNMLRDQLDDGDALLIGVNLVTDASVIEAAYNDSAGITESFNKNILTNVNSLTGSRFDPDAFEHVAFWNAPLRRVEMWLRAREDVEVDLGAMGGELALRAGDGIRTEISRRFKREELEVLMRTAGFSPALWLESPDRRFALILGKVQTVH